MTGSVVTIPRPSHETAWTTAQIDQLTELWGEGLAASAIAERMGLTKNKVIGKVHRLGLKKRLSPVIRKPAPVIVDGMPPTDQPHEPTGCRWIDGDPKSDDWRYCQAEQLDDSTYCETHHPRCYVAASSTPEKANGESE